MEIFLEFGKAENVDFVSTPRFCRMWIFAGYPGKKGKKTEEQKGNIVEDVEIVRIYVSMFVFVGVHDDEFCSQFTWRWRKSRY